MLRRNFHPVAGFRLILSAALLAPSLGKADG